jgi:nucleotide-binding universal stress UspA family protein
VTGGTRQPAAFNRVVCLVDGSPDGLEALRQAATLRAPDGQLVGVVPLDLGLAAEAGFEATHAAAQLEEEAEQARDDAAAALEGIPSAEVEIASGRPAAALRAVAEHRRADLLAIGRHGSSRRRGLIAGSLVTEMIHEASCPVLVARAPAAGEPWVPRTLTVGIDGSDCSLDALGVARALGERLAARVRLLAAMGGKRIDADELGRLGDVEFDERRPVDALVAASEGSDLVVVGCRGLHGLASLGSVSERVAHRAVSPVLVVRRGASHGQELRARVADGPDPASPSPAGE